MTTRTLSALALILSLALVAPVAAQSVPSERAPHSLIAGRLVAVDVLSPTPINEPPSRVRIVVALDGFRRSVEVRDVRSTDELETLLENLGRLVLVSAGIERRPGGGTVYWTVPAQVLPLQG